MKELIILLMFVMGIVAVCLGYVSYNTPVDNIKAYTGAASFGLLVGIVILMKKYIPAKKEKEEPETNTETKKETAITVSKMINNPPQNTTATNIIEDKNVYKQKPLVFWYEDE